MKQDNVYVGVFQETKITNGIHACHRVRYAIWATMAESRHLGLILVVWKENTGWQLEGIVNLGPNVASFLLTSGSWRWYVIVAYVPPDDAPAVYCVEQALEEA